MIVSSSVLFLSADTSAGMMFDLLAVLIPVPIFLLCRYLVGWTLVFCLASGVIAILVPSAWDLATGGLLALEVNSGLISSGFWWIVLIVEGITYGAVFWLIASFRTS